MVKALINSLFIANLCFVFSYDISSVPDTKCGRISNTKPAVHSHKKLHCGECNFEIYTVVSSSAAAPRQYVIQVDSYLLPYVHTTSTEMARLRTIPPAPKHKGPE